MKLLANSKGIDQPFSSKFVQNILWFKIKENEWIGNYQIAFYVLQLITMFEWNNPGLTLFWFMFQYIEEVGEVLGHYKTSQGDDTLKEVVHRYASIFNGLAIIRLLTMAAFILNCWVVKLGVHNNVYALLTMIQWIGLLKYLRLFE